MTSLKDKVTKALDETHILVLGTQILLGFGFQATFQPGFERLAPSGRWLAVCVVALLLVAFLFLVAPTPFHRIAEHGESTQRMHRFTSAVATAALLPFALAIGLSFVIPLQKAFGTAIAILAGVSMGAAALFLWCGLELARKRKDIRTMQDLSQPGDKASLKDRIRQLLTEARIVLPGAQALLGISTRRLLHRCLREAAMGVEGGAYGERAPARPYGPAADGAGGLPPHRRRR
jgi:hypothetical protein